MNVNSVNSNVSSRIRARNAIGFSQLMVRAVRTIFAYPLTSAAYFLALPGLATGMNTSPQANTPQTTEENWIPEPVASNANASSTANATDIAEIETVTLPLDLDSILAAAGYAQEQNTTAPIGWVFSDEPCEAQINGMIFENDANATSTATRWRSNIGANVHSHTELNSEQLETALGAVAADTDGCVLRMYVNEMAAPEIRARMQTQENIQAALRQPEAEQVRCQNVGDVSIQGRDANARVQLEARLQECHREGSNRGAAPVRNRREAESNPVEQENQKKLAALANQIRQQFCPNGINVLHGNTTSNLASLAQLQQQISLLCPSAEINTVSSLNASSSSEFLGTFQLVELLANQLNLADPNDIFIITNPIPEGVTQDLTALTLLVEALEQIGVSIFSADEQGWSTTIPGTYAGGRTSQKISYRRAKRSAEQHTVYIDETATVHKPMIIGILTALGLMLIPIAAIAHRRRRCAARASQQAENQRVREERYRNTSRQEGMIQSKNNPLSKRQRSRQAREAFELEARHAIFQSSDASSRIRQEAQALLPRDDLGRGISEPDLSSVLDLTPEQPDPLTRGLSQLSIFGNNESDEDEEASFLPLLEQRRLLEFKARPISRTTSIPNLGSARVSQLPNFSASTLTLPTLIEQTNEEAQGANFVPSDRLTAQTPIGFDSDGEAIFESPSDSQSTAAPIWPSVKKATSMTDFYRAEKSRREKFKADPENERRLQELEIEILKTRLKKAIKNNDKQQIELIETKLAQLGVVTV